MPGPTLTVDELAEEIGRSSSYVYEHWRELAKRRLIPHPLHGGRPPLAWSRAQVYALLDKELTPKERVIAQAWRAAAAAAAGTRHITRSELEEIEWTDRLNARFAKESRDADGVR